MKWGFQGSIAFVSSSLQMISEGKSVQSFQIQQLNQKTRFCNRFFESIQGSGNLCQHSRLGRFQDDGMKEPAASKIEKFISERVSLEGCP